MRLFRSNQGPFLNPERSVRHTIDVSLRETPCGQFCKPVQAESEIASAERRVKPLAQLLRCATALRVTAPLGCGSRRLVWPKGSLSARSTARMPGLGRGAMLLNDIK